MRTKAKKFSWILGVLALLAGLLAMPASAQAENGDVQIDVHAPEEVDVGSEFYVNATVANVSGSGLSGVDVSIGGYGTDATLVEGDQTQTIDIAVDEVGDVWWKFECDAPGDVTFDVTADGVSDVVTVEQMRVVDPALEIEIIQQPDYAVEPCENFAVKALVHNVSGEPVTNTVVSMALTDGDAEPVINGEAQPGDTVMYLEAGSIEIGGSQEVGFTWHCTGGTDAEFELGATADGIDEGMVVPAEVVVKQVGTEISVELSADRDKLCPGPDCDLSLATVTAKVTNDGDDPASNAKVTLEVDSGDATIQGDATQSLGDIPVDGSATASWTVECTGLTDADLDVTATADDASDDTDTLSIEQADYFVEILEPADGSTMSTEQVFPVKARLVNCTDEPFTDGSMTIDLSDVEAELVDTDAVIEYSDFPTEYESVSGGAVTDTVSFDRVCQCCCVDITWMVECTGTDPAIGDIEVTAEPLEVSPVTDTVEIAQEEKVHLMGGIEVFPGRASEGKLNPMPVDAVAVGDDFSSVVVVANTGGAVAENVVLTKKVEGPSDCVGEETETFDEIKPGESVKWVQECNCEGEGEVKISMSMEGTDENTGEDVLGDNIVIPCPKLLKQYAVSVEYLEPEEGQEFTVCDYFAVKVKIENNSSRDFLTPTTTLEWDETQAEYVTPTLTLDQEEEWTPFDDDVLNAGEIAELTYQMHCIHKGELTFLFKLITEDPRMKVERWVTVVQNPAPPEWAKATVPLTQTWNLMSLPLIPESSDIETVLSRTPVEIETVWGYDAATAMWSNYTPGVGGDLSDMVDGEAYWVDARAGANMRHGTPDPDAILRVWGYEQAPPPPAVPPAYALVEGWNMVGVTIAPDADVQADEYLEGVKDDLMMIYGFDADDQAYYAVPDGGMLETGKGYWVALSASGTVYP